MFIPKHTNVSVDTIRGFFNAYLSHKYLIDYLAEFDAVELLNKNWVYYSQTLKVHSELKQLQDALNFNVKNLAQLVSQIVIIT